MSGAKIAPSLMCADFLHLAGELEVMEREGVDRLHLDIMDGHYVPNLTLGTDFCRAVAAHTSLPLDIHLMAENLEALAPLFAVLPRAAVSFHPEATWHPHRVVEEIRARGARPGIALDPATPVASVREILPFVDLACVMTVNPGYAGQALIPRMLAKVEELAGLKAAEGWNLEIEVDGNVSWQNIPRMLRAGATVLVAGSSSLFDGAPLAENIRRMKRLVEGEG